jgi:hypothetical protein
MNEAQRFVNELNMQIMPKFGYVWRNNRWEWPNAMTKQWEARSAWNEPLVSTGEKVR